MTSFILFTIWIILALSSFLSGIDFLFPGSTLFFWGIITYVPPILPRLWEILLWLLLIVISILITFCTLREEKKLFLDEIKYGYLRFIVRILIQCTSFIIVYFLLHNWIWPNYVQYSDLFVIVLITIFILYRHIELNEYDKKRARDSLTNK